MDMRFSCSKYTRKFRLYFNIKLSLEEFTSANMSVIKCVTFKKNFEIRQDDVGILQLRGLLIQEIEISGTFLTVLIRSEYQIFV